MIEKKTVQAGLICGAICVLFMWAYMSYSSAKMQSPPTPAGMHMMPDGTMMGGPMDTMMMDMTSRMKGKTGAELEKTFLEDMIVHHQGAVDMSKELLKGTTRPELVKFANDIITLQSKEIEMQKQWLREWY